MVGRAVARTKGAIVATVELSEIIFAGAGVV
jgi:hypothetical protein